MERVELQKVLAGAAVQDPGLDVAVLLCSGLLSACDNDQTETQSQDRTPSQMLAAFPKYLIILYGVKFLWVRYDRTNS